MLCMAAKGNQSNELWIAIESQVRLLFFVFFLCLFFCFPFCFVSFFFLFITIFQECVTVERACAHHSKVITSANSNLWSLVRSPRWRSLLCTTLLWTPLYSVVCCSSCSRGMTRPIVEYRGNATNKSRKWEEAHSRKAVVITEMPRVVWYFVFLFFRFL